jgi:hypothetical protein
MVSMIDTILYETSILTCPYVRDPPFIHLICLIATIQFVMEIPHVPTTFFGKARVVFYALAYYVLSMFLYVTWWVIVTSTYTMIFHPYCSGISRLRINHP